MSDLTATNCGCGCDNGNGMSSCLWLILLLCCCGGCGGNGFSGNGCGNDSCLWIILLLVCCGGFGNNGCCGLIRQNDQLINPKRISPALYRAGVFLIFFYLGLPCPCVLPWSHFFLYSCPESSSLLFFTCSSTATRFFSIQSSSIS